MLMQELVQFASVKPTVNVEHALHRLGLEGKARAEAVNLLETLVAGKAFPDRDKAFYHNPQRLFPQEALQVLLRHGLIAATAAHHYQFTYFGLKQCAIVFNLDAPVKVFCIREDTMVEERTVLELLQGLEQGGWQHKVVPRISGQVTAPYTGGDKVFLQCHICRRHPAAFSETTATYSSTAIPTCTASSCSG